MARNDDLLGLGAMWDLERDNAALDEFREIARDERARQHFHDAILALVRSHPVDAYVGTLDRPIHITRMGMNWVEGRPCGHTDVAIAPLSATRVVRTSRGCACEVRFATVFEWVTLGAVLRHVERHAQTVTVTTVASGTTGRVVGVWRDAVTVRSREGVAVIPFASLELVVTVFDVGS
jgi:hypothetical protein